MNKKYDDIPVTRKQVMALISDSKDLRGQDFRKANLANVDFTGCDLTGCNLSYANLKNCIFFGANLTGASLWSANLEDANLVSANLSDADMDYARLKGAMLYGANIKRAVLPLEITAKSDIMNSVENGKPVGGSSTGKRQAASSANTPNTSGLGYRLPHFDHGSTRNY